MLICLFTAISLLLLFYCCMLMTCNNVVLIHLFIAMCSIEFEMKDLSDLYCFLGCWSDLISLGPTATYVA